jgi:acyl carrier protein
MPWDEEFEAVLREHLDLLDPQDPLPPDARLGALGLDSMASIQLLVALEDTFDVLFPDSMLNAETFGDPGSLWLALTALRADAQAESGSSS